MKYLHEFEGFKWFKKKAVPESERERLIGKLDLVSKPDFEQMSPEDRKIDEPQAEPTDEEIVTKVFNHIKKNFNMKLFDYDVDFSRWRVNYNTDKYKFYFSCYYGQEFNPRFSSTYISIDDVYYEVSNELKKQMIDFFKDKREEERRGYKEKETINKANAKKKLKNL